jgi:pyruvate dehydrogenase E1 component beta subunit
MAYGQAINEGLFQAMEADPAVICFGLGVDDPKGIFGTTLGLPQRFGPERVFDMPASENAMTGVAIGAALNGLRPVMSHQRLDFFLLGVDQLVNNAAKWHYMFGGHSRVPITIRLIIGQGWGQGPTHSQSLQSWFVHVPGLKVVMPATAADAKGLLLSAIFDDNPVLYLEHRWLHHVEGEVPEGGDFRTPIGKAQFLHEGGDLTIVAFSVMTIEALHAVAVLERFGVRCDLVDLRSVRPIDWTAIFASVRKTGRLLALDTSHPFCSVASEVVSQVARNCFPALRQAPAQITVPDVPSPTSPALTKGYYPGTREIVVAALTMLGKPVPFHLPGAEKEGSHDVPGEWFKGPF